LNDFGIQKINDQEGGWLFWLWKMERYVTVVQHS